MPRFKTSRSHSRPASHSSGGRRQKQARQDAEEGNTPRDRFIARARKRAEKEEAREERRERPDDVRALARNLMEKAGFETEFNLVVAAKANSHDESTVKRSLPQVRDLRHLLWSSICDYDAKSIDMLEFAERGQGGSIAIKVAIADVDAYAPKESLIDLRAKENATSIDAVRESFPLLPDALSRDLTTFPMYADRLAVIVEFSVHPRGNLKFGKVYRAAVKNKAQLSFGEVGAWLEGNDSEPEMVQGSQGLEEQLRLQDEASLKMGKYRQETGKILKGEEVSESGRVDSLWLFTSANGRANRIIENLAIGANAAIADYLEGKGLPVVRRVITEPRDWAGIAGVAKAKGVELPAAPDATALGEFLESERKENSAKFPSLCGAIAKMMGNGEYVVYSKMDAARYFGFAMGDSAVGTSPNQRYMDLLIQRMLKAAASGTAIPYSKGEIAEFAEWCTERENAARKLERAVKFASAQAQA